MKIYRSSEGPNLYYVANTSTIFHATFTVFILCPMLLTSEASTSPKSIGSRSIDFTAKILHDGRVDVRVVPHLHHPRNHGTSLQHLLPSPPWGGVSHAETRVPYSLTRQILVRPNVQLGPRIPRRRRLRSLSLLKSISQIAMPAMTLS
jgi:hypothetical protein